MADDSVTIRFGARIEDLVKGVDSIKEKLGELGEYAQKVGELFAIGFGARELIEFAKSMGELGTQTERSMAILGIGAEKVGELQGIAKLTGTSFEALESSLGRMSLRMQESQRDAFNPTAQGLKALGISAKDLIGIPTDQYMLKLAESFGKFNSSLNLTTAAQAAFGRGITNQLPLLLQGKEHFEEMQKAVAATGSTLSDAQAHAFSEAGDKMTLLGLSAQGLGIKLFTVLAPAVDGIVKSLTDLVQWLRKGAEEGGYLGKSFEVLGATARVVAVAVASIVSTLQALMLVAEEGLLAITLNMTTSEAARIAKEFENIGNKWKETVASIYANPLRIEVSKGGGKGNVGTMDVGGKGALAAELAAIQERIKLSGMAYQSYVEQLDTELKTFRITESDKTRLQIEAINNRVAAEKHYVEQELALYGLTKQERQKLQSELTTIDAKGAADRQKVTDKLTIDQVKSWETNLGQMQSAWDSQLKGLLARTVSWKEAMRSVMSDLIMAIIKEFEKIVVIETLAKAMQNLFKGFDLTGIFKAIAANIALTYSAVTAYFAPTLGPYAPVAGAAVAAVAGAAAGAFMAAPLPGAEQGAWNVPQNSAWNLHQGELVLPRVAAQAFREQAEGGRGGGGSINVYAMDGASVLRVVNQHAAVFARVIGGHMGSNPSSHS